MRFIYNFFFFIVTTSLFSACAKDFFNQTIEIDPPVFEKQLVVQGSYSTLETEWYMYIGNNVGILDNADTLYFTSLSNAKVEVLKEGQPFATLPYSANSSSYYADLPEAIEIGKRYTLRVSHPDFTTVEAEQLVPDTAEVLSVKYKKDGSIDPGGERLSEVEVRIQDKASIANYYKLNVFQLCQYEEPIYDPNTGQQIGVDTIDCGLNHTYYERSTDPNVIRGVRGQALISDEYFDGEAYTFNFQFYNYKDDVSNYTVVLSSITKDEFLNLSTRQRASEVQDLPFAEPVTVYSNVANGLGAFLLSSEQSFEVK